MPKYESRAKYSGTKAHFDEHECQWLLDWHKDYKKLGTSDAVVVSGAINFVREMAKSIRNLQAEHPDLLKERTEEQVKAALLKDKQKIEEQLAAGKHWKKVK